MSASNDDAVIRRSIELAFRHALATLDPATRVRAAVDALELHGSVAAPLRIVAIGKAAPSMALGAVDGLRVLGRGAIGVIVVTSDGVSLPARLARRSDVEVLVASHPLPDARSVTAARRCLETVRAPGGDILVLISGGASSLVCAPAAGITLTRKRAIARVMLSSGATIDEINVVRKHLSRIKGGGLARAASSARIYTLVASDVVAGLRAPSHAAAFVGSGPTLPDPSTRAEAQRLLARYAPRFARTPLVETLRQGSTFARALVRRSRVVLCPEDLAQAMARELGALGLRARALASSSADVAAVAEETLRIARRLRPGEAVTRAAEPSVSIGARAGAHAGRGGRSTHLATLVGPRLPPGVAFAAIATDGVDGASGTAGAIVSGAFAAEVVRRLGEGAIARALRDYDTGTLHREVGTARRSVPTGHNLADLHVLVRAASPARPLP